MFDFPSDRPEILVIGDLMLDQYLWGTTERISPEAPVAVIDVKKETQILGGAGNVINNLAALGANVSIASVIGADDAGLELKEMLHKINIDCSSVIVEERRKTSKKNRIIVSQQQVIRYDQESKNSITSDSADKLFKSVESTINQYDIVLLSDYGKGVLTEDLTKALISMIRLKNIRVLVDPKGRDYSKYSGAFLLTPNKKEASLSTGIDIIDDTSLKDAGYKLKNRFNLNVSMITLGEDGISIFDGDMKNIPTQAQEVFDVTGAGDTVLAAMGFALCHNKTIYEAAQFANYAAAVVVGKVGCATTTIDEIMEYISSIHNLKAAQKHRSVDHIKSFNEIETIANQCRRCGEKIVFTNGCFDILHAGHVRYLEEARSYGDILVVGVNSDISVKELKGKQRPINTQDDRSYILSALDAVDFVVIFNEETPYELIKKIQPDILVKGGDYKDQEVVGSDIADRVKLVEFIDGKSTTGTINKIKNLHGTY
ncbi:MAG: D-glycero-beta-D-manno-heptose-7-phosphate kinase [Desulfobacula sp.]|nr:D-glycero-beta-D-manno-heptose-7-phosphate kinase [Desulfobacula sp.]